MDLVTTLQFVSGFVLLVVGAELLVRGAAKMAESLGISPLIVGLTVVAYGTSAPELAVTMQSVFARPPEPDLAVGNVVGSNISNVLLVLGLSALIAPLAVSRQMIREGVPLMIAVSFLVLLVGFDGQIMRWEGGLLVLGALAVTYRSVRAGRAETGVQADDEKRIPSVPWTRALRGAIRPLLLLVVGLGVMLWGASWLVAGAIVMATWLGVSKLVIGLTVVAVGTSLPEIATSIVAGLRGQRDIAVGNVVGSNLFNVLLVLGLTATFSPLPIKVSEHAMAIDIPVMIVSALACLPIFFTGFVISRAEGAFLLAYYAAYTLFLFLKSTQHAALEEYTLLMLYFVIPISTVSLAGLAWRALRRQNATT